MIQIYIKHTDNNNYLLDVEESEVINLKTIVKDLNDITKIFSPFTQSFNIKATDKNKRLLGYIGNEKIQRLNNDGKFDCLIYVSGFLMQSGKLSFEETNYNNKRQDKIKVNFASNLTGLVNKLGDITIQELFQDSLGAYDERLVLEWSPTTIASYMQGTYVDTLSNDVAVKYNVPFISNKRVWNVDGTVNNINYTNIRNNTTNNSITLDEVRPSVNYMSIMQHLLIKIGVPVICPLFETPELRDLMVYCTGKSLVTPNDVGYLLKPFGAINYTEFGGTDQTAKWAITGGGASGVFKIKRNVVPFPNAFPSNLRTSLVINGLNALEGTSTSIKVSMVNASNNVIIDSQEIINNSYNFTIIDNAIQTILDGSGELFIKFVIQPNTLVSWTSIDFKTEQIYNKDAFIKFFRSISNNSASSVNFGGNSLNLISALPKMKAKDFLASFFKMYNIQVINSGKPDGSMYWLTPQNINEVNKVYSKRIVDYTPFVDTETLTKSRGNEYNQYIFKHKESKYYDALYGDGTRFGELVYPLTPPDKLNTFEVKTEYSIIKQNQSLTHPSGVKTALAFEREDATIGPNGGLVFKPVYDEFTLLYTRNVEVRTVFAFGIRNRFGFKLTETVNTPLSRVNEPTFKHPTTGKTLSFGAEGIDTDSLYVNYYQSFIEFILNVNVYKSEFEINLPANEIFLNFSNQNIGESNIPTGFRPQNEIVIGEQRYLLIESLINLTTGKGKLTLLNF